MFTQPVPCATFAADTSEVPFSVRRLPIGVRRPYLPRDEHMPHQFTIKLDNHPEALANLLEALAARGVDLRAIGISGIGRNTTAVMITNNDAATRAVLRVQHSRFLEGEVVITSVPDQPGALAHLVRQLADAGIGIQGVLLLRWHQGKAELAMSADNPARLRRALGACTYGSHGPHSSPLAHV